MKRPYSQVDPDIQRDIVADYEPHVRGSGYKSLAKHYGLPVGTVDSIIKRAKLHGDPVTERGHKPRALDAKQERKLVAALDRDPYATNRVLAQRAGVDVSESTVSRTLARAQPAFSEKVVQDQEPEELVPSWMAAARRWLGGTKNIPLDERVYMDESGVYENEAKKKGRSRIGKPIFRARPHHAKKYHLHVYAKRSGVLFWSLRRHYADNDEVEGRAQLAAQTMTRGDVLIWDRLGRSGRKKHPDKQHYSPVALGYFRDVGVEVRYLPPKGKYFDPMELLFNDLKSHYIRPARPGNGKTHTYDELYVIIDKYMTERAPIVLPGFFDARANGAYAKKHGIV